MRQLSQRLVVVVERGVATALEIYFMRNPPVEVAEDRRNFELFEV